MFFFQPLFQTKQFKVCLEEGNGDITAITKLCYKSKNIKLQSKEYGRRALLSVANRSDHPQKSK